MPVSPEPPSPAPHLSRTALRILSQLTRPGDHYALSLSRELRLGNGTLFPALEKLETAGLISGAFEPQGPRTRPRRLYTLTAHGQVTFEAQRAALLADLGLAHA